ncbi:YicC/YloC family endoribonuclease [Sneathiella sp.]|uniref:YicC/YloC family endoribonuclease n=1 Tax=Sneathiella sp. TaxID=1964365 RepID=UPI0025E36A52|nr:YicC/YloC family endoribonuclease [Sneathiella sp.]
MTINSMTGFARASGSFKGVSWLWEMKSVNGRGLEVRCRIPAGFDHLEDPLRKLVKTRITRGNVNIHLQFDRASAGTAYQVNHEFLEELLSLAHHYAERGEADRPRMDGMLALRGVIETRDETAGEDADDEGLAAAMLSSAGELVESLAAARSEEGRALGPVLIAQLDEIKALVARATEIAAGWPDKMRAKIKAQMAILLESGELDEGRLEQELALLTTKADIAEELDRLTSHIAATRDMLEGASAPVGRRLDFICQEFNREANTLCSKANDKELTQIGLDLKVLVDKMREQVQNIE